MGDLALRETSREADVASIGVATLGRDGRGRAAIDVGMKVGPETPPGSRAPYLRQDSDPLQARGNGGVATRAGPSLHVEQRQGGVGVVGVTWLADDPAGSESIGGGVLGAGDAHLMGASEPRGPCTLGGLCLSAAGTDNSGAAMEVAQVDSLQERQCCGTMSGFPGHGQCHDTLWQGSAESGETDTGLVGSGSMSCVSAGAVCASDSSCELCSTCDVSCAGGRESMAESGDGACSACIVAETRSFGGVCSPGGALEAPVVGMESADEAGGEACASGRNGESKRKRRRRRKRSESKLLAHALFLQYMFRRSRMVRPGCWSRGGWRGLRLYRPPSVFGCRNGLLLASEEDFEEQRRRAERVLGWYANYVLLLRRFRSRRTPTALVTFCGGGGVSEGVKRAGGASHGQDLRDQPDFKRRFGDECFTCGDSCSALGMRALKRRVESFVTIASPPCKAYSTSLMQGQPSEPPMIGEVRTALEETGGLYVIENVPGARSALGSRVCRQIPQSYCRGPETG